MSPVYRLTPPFLHLPEQTDFSKAWEGFCCKVLNLKFKTDEIYVRNPPEQGVDLFYPTQKIAYQCKSVESGKSGDFNSTHAISSYNAAQQHQQAIGWVEYALCTNVDITGTAEATLRSAIPNLTILLSSR